jgi:hypothetical protein
LSEQRFQKWEYIESEQDTEIKQRPYSQDPSRPEFPEIDLADDFFFFDEEKGYEKTAEYEEKVYADIAIAHEILLDEKIGRGLFNVVEVCMKTMKEKNGEKGEEPKPIKIFKVYFFMIQERKWRVF